jgi:hypothetical protein
VATFTEASVEVSLTIFDDEGVRKLRISATSLLANGTGIEALYTDAIAYAKAQFSIP